MGNHVLLVDDDPEVVLVLTSLLEQRGFRVETACDVKQGLECIRRDPPGVVLVELTLAPTSTAEFLSGVAMLFGVPPFRVIPLSVSRNLRALTSRARVGRWLPKPGDVRRLFSLVEASVSARALPLRARMAPTAYSEEVLYRQAS